MCVCELFTFVCILCFKCLVVVGFSCLCVDSCLDLVLLVGICAFGVFSCRGCVGYCYLLGCVSCVEFWAVSLELLVLIWTLLVICLAGSPVVWVCCGSY